MVSLIFFQLEQYSLTNFIPKIWERWCVFRNRRSSFFQGIMSSEPTEPAPSIPGTSSIPPEPSVSSTASSFSASLVNGIPEFVPRRSAVLPPSEHATPETHPDDSDESCDPGRGPAGGRGGVDYPSSMTFPSFTAQTVRWLRCFLIFTHSDWKEECIETGICPVFRH